MLIAGWGKDAKNLAFVGIHKCSHCNNYSPMSLYEVARKISIYFVPVAKFQKRYFVVCPVCDSSYELEAHKKNELLRESVELPDEETASNIWGDLSTWLEELSNRGEDPARIGEMAVRELEKEYDPKHVAYIVNCYRESGADSDMAASEALPAVQLVPFLVTGCEKSSGEDMDVLILAENELDAERRANGRGYMVQYVRRMRCPQCRYLLTLPQAQAQASCPECGHAF